MQEYHCNGWQNCDEAICADEHGAVTGSHQGVHKARSLPTNTLKTFKLRPKSTELNLSRLPSKFAGESIVSHLYTIRAKGNGEENTAIFTV